jgi:voltage-gated potassium channel
MIVLVIAINTSAFIASTELGHEYDPIFDLIENISVAIFTIEYIIRVWCAADKKQYRGHREWEARLRFSFPITNLIQCRFIISPMGLVDLASIVPYFVGVFISKRLAFATIIRVLRIFRLFKSEKYSHSFSIIGQVIYRQRGVLLATNFFSLVILVLVATLMWLSDGNNAPESFGR